MDKVLRLVALAGALFIVVVLYFRQGLVGFVEPAIVRLWRRPAARAWMRRCDSTRCRCG